MKWHKEHKAAITIIGCNSEFKIPFSEIELSNETLKKMHEKPIQDVIINTGVMLSYILAVKNMDMNSFIDLVIEKEKITVFPNYKDNWFEIGQWEKYKNTLKMLDKKEISK